MTKVLAIQIFAAALVIASAGAAATVAIRANPTPTLQAIAAAPVSQLVLAARDRGFASKQ